MDIENKFVGAKFYKWEAKEETPYVLRIKKIHKEKNIATCYDNNNKLISVSLEELKDDYRMIRPDGVITFSILDMPNGIDDVIVALQSFERSKESALPYAICRQCIEDVFSNMNATSGQKYTGISISQDTCPPNIPFENLLVSNGVKYNKAVRIYLDDNLDTILKFINTHKYDTLLSTLSKKYEYTIYRGYERSLKDLLKSNNFFYDFRQCFNIKELPFHIEDEDESLSVANTEFLSKELNEAITATYVTKYSKEIDFSNVKRDYVLASPVNDDKTREHNVFIVGYDSNGPLKTSVEN